MGFLILYVQNFVKVVYMDEPSSGLDPASRKNLWNVVKHAKQNRAIILTSILSLFCGFWFRSTLFCSFYLDILSLLSSHANINILSLSTILIILGFMLSAHSMEEAEALCDRLGIFVNGNLQCVGNAKEVTLLNWFAVSKSFAK